MYGTVARPITLDNGKKREIEARLDRIAELRAQIYDALTTPERHLEAIDLYEQLMMVNADQCLPLQQQRDIARLLYAQNKFPQAAGAFEKYLKHYPKDRENDEARLLVGIIYARDLSQYEAAEGHLKLALQSLADDKRRKQCQHWLDEVAAVLRAPAPDAG